MWSFNTFKDKRYWILFVPTVVIFILTIIFASDYVVEKPYIPFIYVVLFWFTYHVWKYIDERNIKTRSNK